MCKWKKGLICHDHFFKKIQMTRILTILILLFLFDNVKAQFVSDTYKLRWKCHPDSAIVYEYEEHVIDHNYRNSEEMVSILRDNRRLLKWFDDYQQTISDFQIRLRNDFSVYDVITPTQDLFHFRRFRVKNDSADVGKPKLTKKQLKSQIQIEEGWLFGAYLDNTGSNRPSYLIEEHKNIIHLLTQLPDEPIAVGDTWDLDIRFLRATYKFKPDSVYRKNQAKLDRVREDGKEVIAVVIYDLNEYQEGRMENPNDGKEQRVITSFQYTGTAEFNITKGRWESYDVVSITTQKSNTEQIVVKGHNLIPVIPSNKLQEYIKN